jgi:hypothetical protein
MPRTTLEAAKGTRGHRLEKVVIGTSPLADVRTERVLREAFWRPSRPAREADVVDLAVWRAMRAK